MTLPSVFAVNTVNCDLKSPIYPCFSTLEKKTEKSSLTEPYTSSPDSPSPRALTLPRGARHTAAARGWEEGAADAATDGAVEEGHGAAPVSASGGHGGEAEGGQVVEDGRGSTVQGQVAAPEGHGRAAVSALRGQGAAPEGGQGSPKEGDGDGVTASDATTSAWLEGMDPNSTYLLKIKLLGNPKKARKDIKCFCFDKVIGSDLTNYKDLVESIVEQYHLVIWKLHMFSTMMIFLKSTQK